jgi:hypothetical protein
MIALAVIPPDCLRETESLAAALAKAVDRGAMAQADQLTQALLAAVRVDRPIRIPLASWVEFNRKVRQAMPGVAAGYLIDPDTCTRLLRLEGGDAEAGLRTVLEAAAASGSHLLQLPLDAE